MDFEKDIRIDETALDIEWLNQAELAIKYGNYAVGLKKKAALVREEFKIMQAEVRKEVNDNPEITGKSKPTVADVDAYLEGHPKLVELKRRRIEAEYEVEMADVARNEICFTRKAALENLVRLHAQQYFAGPSVPRDLPTMREAKEKKEQKDANKKVTVKVSRTK